MLHRRIDAEKRPLTFSKSPPPQLLPRCQMGRFLTVSIACAALCATQARGQDFKIENAIAGVSVSGPGAPEFEALASPVRAKMANRSLFQPLLPFSVAVQNTSSKTISYYVIRYNRVNSSGQPLRTVVRVNHLMQGGLAPGSSELTFPVSGLSLNSEVAPNGAASIFASQDRVLSEFKQSPAVTAVLDAVVFQDGEFRGLDTTETLWLLNSKVDGVFAILQKIESTVSAPGADVPRLLMAMLQETAPFQPISTGPIPQPREKAASNSEHTMAAAVVEANLYAARQLILSSALAAYQREALPR